MPTPHTNDRDATVVLLHGLARKPQSMGKMQRALAEEGYQVLNIGYPSRSHRIEELADHVQSTLSRHVSEGQPLHFVTHSMGGILVRYLQQTTELPHARRLVMLSPPNRGSEVVDKLRWLPPFHWVNGPAGEQLGTEPDGLVARLGPPTFETGIITGNRSVNWMLSSLIPGPNDGKVSVESARLEGMKDFLVVPASHPYIMKKPQVIDSTIRFLESGSFREDR